MTAVYASDSLFPDFGVADALAWIAMYPRLRYMGSKYKLVPHLVQAFTDAGGRTALDAFSGSGVVAYTMKSLGYAVMANDFLTFPSIIAGATVANDTDILASEDVDIICGPSADDRDFIRSTFDGLYFTAEDRAFLDSAWSHTDQMTGAKRALAISALVLSAARKRPRGVFTFTDARYDDGRRHLRMPLHRQFRECAALYNRVVFDSGAACWATSRDVFELDPGGYDVVYLDPPYAPPRDDNCYVKRYHFLEGLAVYWRGLTIMENTKTKKLAKTYTPFSYKHSASAALAETIERFKNATIVLSYSSNAVPDLATIEGMLRAIMGRVEVRSLEHRYSFGAHASALRRSVSEYVLIAS